MEINKKKVWQWLCATLLILVVPNIICWIIQSKVFMIRGIFVWEYFLIACLYPYLNRRLFMVIWVLFSIFDMVFATCSFFFMDFFEIIHALAKIPALSLVDVLKWTGLLILLIGITLAMFVLMERHNRSYPFLRFKFLWPFIVGMLIVDFFNGQGPLRRWSPRLYNTHNNIISVPSYTLILSIRDALFSGKMNNSHVEYLGSVAQTIFAQQPDSAAYKKQVLILVESWGLLKDSALQREILSPLYQLNANHSYELREGHTRFKYLTQAGEFREITGYLYHSYQVHEERVKQNSIFIKKQQQGYHVIGLHGNTWLFYRRHIMWPALGVQEMYFSEDFNKLSMPLCGGNEFRGICDTAINTWLFNNMHRQPERKEFYYWVTLSTHIPLVKIHDEDYNMFAEKWKAKGMSENILQMAYQDRLLFKDLAEKLSKPGSPKVHMLLVGDHAPPCYDPADRKWYDAQLVPYIELKSN